MSSASDGAMTHSESGRPVVTGRFVPSRRSADRSVLEGQRGNCRQGGGCRWGRGADHNPSFVTTGIFCFVCRRKIRRWSVSQSETGLHRVSEPATHIRRLLGATPISSMAVSISRSVDHGPKYWLLRFGMAVFLSMFRSPSTALVDDVVPSTSTPDGAGGGSITIGGTIDNTFRQLRRRDRQ